jgi:hypothetical protein
VQVNNPRLIIGEFRLDILDDVGKVVFVGQGDEKIAPRTFIISTEIKKCRDGII